VSCALSSYSSCRAGWLVPAATARSSLRPLKRLAALPTWHQRC
jgi:hypothetical protein